MRRRRFDMRLEACPDGVPLDRTKSFMTGRDCVFTVLFGGHEDLLEQPTAGTSTVDFIYFTDEAELQSETWRVIHVEPVLPADTVRSSRFPKICPHYFLHDYERSLYIDNAVLLHRPPEDLMERVDPGRHGRWVLYPTAFRKTLEDEFAAVLEAGFDTREVCLEQLRHYRHTRTDILRLRPIAGGILARRHRRPDIIDAMNRAIEHSWADRVRLALPQRWGLLNRAMRNRW